MLLYRLVWLGAFVCCGNRSAQNLLILFSSPTILSDVCLFYRSGLIFRVGVISVSTLLI